MTPAGAHRGTALLFHSGGWMGGSAADELPNALLLQAAGWRAVAVDYPRGSIVGSYRAALQAAAAYREPGHPLIAVGESAGGSIAEWLAGRRRVDASYAVAAPADFVTWPLVPEWRSAIQIGEDPWRWSPARIYQRPASAPLIVYHSRGDSVVPAAQALELVKRGARAYWLDGEHLADTRWRADLLVRISRGVATRP